MKTSYGETEKEVFAAGDAGAGAIKPCATDCGRRGLERDRRRDGRELFYLGFDGRVQAVPVKLSAEGPSIVVVQNWEALLPHKL